MKLEELCAAVHTARDANKKEAARRMQVNPFFPY